MNILEMIKRDATQITSNSGEFAQPVTFISPTGKEVVIDAIFTFHHLGYDLQTAQEINTLKAHCCASEQKLREQGYPVRDAKLQVNMNGHKIKAKDVQGIEWLFIVSEFFPNHRTGTISFILGSYKQPRDA
jgi:hypothetical protein